MTRATVACLAVIMATLASAVPARAADIVGSAMVIDGDTIEIDGQRINIYGVDAPELDQVCDRAGEAYRCGRWAAQLLSEALGESPVVCKPKGRRAPGRPIRAVCWLDGVDIGGWLVAQGLALPARKSGRAYLDEQEHARAYRKGIWGGGFTLPWVWRGEKP